MRLLRIPARRESSLETAALFSAAGSMGQGNIQLQPAEMGSGLTPCHHNLPSSMACWTYSLDLPSKCPEQVAFLSLMTLPSLSYR